MAIAPHPDAAARPTPPLALPATQPPSGQMPPAARTPRTVRPHISATARALGLRTVAALKLELLRQGGSWWSGRRFHCPLCDENYNNATLAAEHLVRSQHPVLRLDPPEMAPADADAPEATEADQAPQAVPVLPASQAPQAGRLQTHSA